MGGRTNKKLRAFAGWIKRRSIDIRENLDYECPKCKELKKQGFRRPSCEECGLVILTNENGIVWRLFQEYSPSLIIISGFGGWGINTEFAKELCNLKGIFNDDYLEFIKRLQVIAGEIYKVEKKEEEDVK
ncbi:MAG: hypothetical protein M0R03_19755 [Novosphingobium sp.]|jgi:hypothetical protein|nr:hypothetical protein [Novosphingobium sp.]